MKKLIILTGAGMSSESGIKTFRDSGGLWEEYDVNKSPPRKHGSGTGISSSVSIMKEDVSLKRVFRMQVITV